MREWSPDSWQGLEALQQATYEDAGELARVLGELSELPPLVTSWEIETLRQQLAEAALGERFVLQGGDCAERFDECSAEIITNKLKILMQMSLVLTHGLRKKVVRIGRIAGQYAKPRSAPTEERDGVTLPAYRGDIINSLEFTPEARRPDPTRMLRAYERSAMTLNFIRSLIQGGFADLHHPEYWQLDFVRKSSSDTAAACLAIGEQVQEALRFMEMFVDGRLPDLHRVDFFTSHEALHLHYEQAHTRRVPRREGFYNLGVHFPWIGMRTATAGSAHLEYIRGIQNPIGIKVGPSVTVDWLLELLDIVDPHNIPGRVTLIHRFGVDKISSGLPPLLAAVRKSGRTVLWISDPMHGNTRTTANGVKTRRFDDILRELVLAIDIHAAEGSHLGGVHFELTGDSVTECIGGASGLTEDDLGSAYRSHVDPRLNYEQALEMALLIAQRQITARSTTVRVAR
jgi:3-deoxy-7-phosphoheptulonate synthase